MFTERSAYRLLFDAFAEVAKPDAATRKLRSFADLPQGWSHGEGGPVSVDAIRAAEKFLEAALLLQVRADVFPGTNGECSVTFYQDEKSVEVIVGPSELSTFGLHVEEGKGFQFTTILDKDQATLEEVLGQIRGLVPDAWRSFASYRSVNSTQRRVDFPISSSNNRLVLA